MGFKVSEREACAFSLREQKAKHDFAFDARSPGCHENSLSPRNAIADLWHIISQDRNTSQTRCIVQTMAQCWGGEKRTRSTKKPCTPFPNTATQSGVNRRSCTFVFAGEM